MTFPSRRTRRVSRVLEARVSRPELWMCALIVVGMLLIEVWQTSSVAELSLNFDRTHSAYVESSARLDFVRAELERRTTRAELAPLASRLGLAPAEVQQIVALPSEYLADGDAPTRDGDPVSMLALAERASRVLVPEARALGNAEK